MALRHPCPFHDEVLDCIAAQAPPGRYPLLLDPFCGTGRIHELANATVGLELEPEWAAMSPGTLVGDARALPFPDASFDAIATSPCFGNRMADHHEARDPSFRHTYRHLLGRPLGQGNAGAMQWGEDYRQFHRRAWSEAVRVLRPGGRLVLNMKDHVRKGVRQPVTDWHAGVLNHLGLVFVCEWVIDAPGMRHGANAELRCEEVVIVFDKPNHEPIPFADAFGGGIRCICGWSVRTSRRAAMQDAWNAYRKHWSEMHPDTRTFAPIPPGVQEQMFDDGPYRRR